APCGPREVLRRRHRVVRLVRLVEVREAQPLRGGLLDDEAQPRRALVPPVAEQLGVERADTQAAVADALADARDEVRGIGAGLAPRAPGVVDGAGDRPRAMLVLRLAPRVAVSGLRRIAV